MTLMPTSQMEVRGQGTTNTILLQDVRKPDWCAQNGNPACAASSFPTKARRLKLSHQSQKAQLVEEKQ